MTEIPSDYTHEGRNQEGWKIQKAIEALPSQLINLSLVDLLWQCAVSQPVFVGLFLSASVNEDGHFERISHRPVNHSVIVKKGIFFAVKLALVAMRSNVSDELHKQLSVYSFADNVFVRPRFRVGLRKRPLYLLKELSQIPWQSNGVTHYRWVQR